MSTLEGRLRDLIAIECCLDDDEVKPDSRLEDLGLDSLDREELHMALENEFDIQIPDDEFDKLETVADIQGHIERVTAH